MSWVVIALIAQFVLGTSAVFDKMLLKRGYFSPLVFTFWFSALGVVSLVVVPFGFHAFSLKVLLISILAGITFDVAMYFFYAALHKGDASGTLTITGGLSPIATLIFSFFLLDSVINGADLIGFAVLLIGGFLFFRIKERGNQLASFYLIFTSAIVLSLSNVLTKMVFNDTNFVTGFVLIKCAGVIPALALLLHKRTREEVVPSLKRGNHGTHGLYYFLNRAYAALGSILVYFAISKTHPALVDASQSFKYVVIFFASWFLLRERHRGWLLAERIIATITVILGFVWLGIIDYARNLPVDPNRQMEWGVTFSDKFSRELGLDWKKNFESIVADLKPKKVRLVAYWDNIEKRRGEFDFSDLDWQIKRATDNNIEVVLALGEKVPRWPECHIPRWAGELVELERGQALRAYMQRTVEHFRDEPIIKMWQIENEPYLPFGDCPEREDEFMEKETRLVRSLDPTRPILTTDGGEFGNWYKVARIGDVFGTTMYRKVYPSTIGPIVGIIQYPISPSFFKFKSLVTRWIIKDTHKKFIVIELQGEPWFSTSVQNTPYGKQIEIFGPEYFASTIQFAKDAGFNEYYLWGSEWWYWMKVKHNDPRYWEIAKKVINSL